MRIVSAWISVKMTPSFVRVWTKLALTIIVHISSIQSVTTLAGYALTHKRNWKICF